MNTVFVGNLPYAATENDVRRLFERLGQVRRCTLVLDRATGRSRGIAFVEMATPAEVAKVITELNGQELLGRCLRLNEAAPREAHPAAGPSRGYSRAERY